MKRGFLIYIVFLLLWGMPGKAQLKTVEMEEEEFLISNFLENLDLQLPQPGPFTKGKEIKLVSEYELPIGFSYRFHGGGFHFLNDYDTSNPLVQTGQTARYGSLGNKILRLKYRCANVGYEEVDLSKAVNLEGLPWDQKDGTRRLEHNLIFMIGKASANVFNRKKSDLIPDPDYFYVHLWVTDNGSNNWRTPYVPDTIPHDEIILGEKELCFLKVKEGGYRRYEWVKDINGTLFPTELYTKYDQWRPQVKGGESALYTFLRNNIHYTDSMRKAGLEGTAFVSLHVDEKGNLSDAKIAYSDHPSFNEPAIRGVMATHRQWNPAIQNEQPVSADILVPVPFRIYPAVPVQEAAVSSYNSRRLFSSLLSFVPFILLFFVCAFVLWGVVFLYRKLPERSKRVKQRNRKWSNKQHFPIPEKNFRETKNPNDKVIFIGGLSHSKAIKLIRKTIAGQEAYSQYTYDVVVNTHYGMLDGKQVTILTFPLDMRFDSFCLFVLDLIECDAFRYEQEVVGWSYIPAELIVHIGRKGLIYKAEVDAAKYQVRIATTSENYIYWFREDEKYGKLKKTNITYKKYTEPFLTYEQIMAYPGDNIIHRVEGSKLNKIHTML